MSGEADTPRGSVLIVDDDRTVVRIVSTYLGRAGYRTHAAGDGFEALGIAAEQWPDLVVLDLTLPGLAGYDVMRRLKDRGQVFVILLSARGQPGDRVTGLRLGADDYVPKPFSPNELVARVDAVLRRAERPPATGEAVVHEGLEIDCDGRRVRVRGAEVALTVREFELLHFFARHPGKVFSPEQLMQQVWKTSHCADTGTVPVHIRRLRRKIEEDPSEPSWVRTVWGVGYRFQVPALSESSTPPSPGRKRACLASVHSLQPERSALQLVTRPTRAVLPTCLGVLGQAGIAAI